MKKVTLKLSWDEMNTLSVYIDSTINQYPEELPKAYKWQWRLVQSVMILWSIKLKQKCVFKKSTPFKLSLDVPQASAFMLFFGWNADMKITTHLGITVLKIQNEINQQLQ